MKYKNLVTCNNKIDLERVEDLLSLYEGGYRFESRLDRFLLKSFSDTFDIYSKKKEIAKSCYSNYFAQVINYYVGFLFAYQLTYKSSNESPEFYSEFREDADNCGTDFHEVLRQSFTSALTSGVSFWSIEFPTEEDQKDVLRAKIKSYDISNLVDWEYDEDGNLDWVLTKEITNRRRSVDEDRSVTSETFTVFTKDTIKKYEISWDGTKKMPKPKAESEIPLKEEIIHNFGVVPVVFLKLTEGLTIGDKIAPLQVRNFRQTLAHEWALNRTTYAIPVIKTDEREEISKIFNSTAHAIILDSKGSFDYSTPPSEAIEAIKMAMKQSKDELFRVANLNMLGVENNSYALVRSGLSRNIDASTAHKTLKAYGALIREAAQKTMNLISKARGEDIVWNVQGFELLESFDAEALVKILNDLNGIPVPDLVIKELVKKLSIQLLADADELTKVEVEKACDSIVIEYKEVEQKESKSEEPKESEEESEDEEEAPLSK